MRSHLAVAAAAFVLLAAGDADANDVLSDYLTADNYFFAYISTSPSTLGTLIASGSNWGSTYALTPTTLTPGTTYYLTPVRSITEQIQSVIVHGGFGTVGCL